MDEGPKTNTSDTSACGGADFAAPINSIQPSAELLAALEKEGTETKSAVAGPTILDVSNAGDINEVEGMLRNAGDPTAPMSSQPVAEPMSSQPVAGPASSQPAAAQMSSQSAAGQTTQQTDDGGEIEQAMVPNDGKEYDPLLKMASEKKAPAADFNADALNAKAAVQQDDLGDEPLVARKSAYAIASSENDDGKDKDIRQTVGKDGKVRYEVDKKNEAAEALKKTGAAVASGFNSVKAATSSVMTSAFGLEKKEEEKAAVGSTFAETLKLTQDAAARKTALEESEAKKAATHLDWPLKRAKYAFWASAVFFAVLGIIPLFWSVLNNDATGAKTYQWLPYLLIPGGVVALAAAYLYYKSLPAAKEHDPDHLYEIAVMTLGSFFGFAASDILVLLFQTNLYALLIVEAAAVIFPGVLIAAAKSDLKNKKIATTDRKFINRGRVTSKIAYYATFALAAVTLISGVGGIVAAASGEQKKKSEPAAVETKKADTEEEAPGEDSFSTRFVKMASTLCGTSKFDTIYKSKELDDAGLVLCTESGDLFEIINLNKTSGYYNVGQALYLGDSRNGTMQQYFGDQTYLYRDYNNKNFNYELILVTDAKTAEEAITQVTPEIVNYVNSIVAANVKAQQAEIAKNPDWQIPAETLRPSLDISIYYADGAATGLSKPQDYLPLATGFSQNFTLPGGEKYDDAKFSFSADSKYQVLSEYLAMTPKPYSDTVTEAISNKPLTIEIPDIDWWTQAYDANYVVQMLKNSGRSSAAGQDSAADQDSTADQDGAADQDLEYN